MAASISQQAGAMVSNDREVRALFNAVLSELTDLRTQYAALLAKLDADAGVTDTNYAATVPLAAAQLTS